MSVNMASEVMLLMFAAFLLNSPSNVFAQIKPPGQQSPPAPPQREPQSFTSPPIHQAEEAFGLDIKTKDNGSSTSEVATRDCVLSLEVYTGTWEDKKPILPQNPHASNWLVLTWPPGYCLQHDCLQTKMPKYPMFIVHGLWPVDSCGNILRNHSVNGQKHSEDIIALIRESRKFDRQFELDMDKYWPSLSGVKNLGFWLHEWNDHGTKQNFLNPKGYFGRAKNEAILTDLLNTLSQGGIRPSYSKRYPHEKYMAAIRKKTNGNAVLLCIQTESHSNVLSEVVICLNERVNRYVPCNVPPNYQGLCNPDEDIWFFPYRK